MRRSSHLLKYSLVLALVLALDGVPVAEADDVFTLGIKGWYASMAATGFEDGDEIFDPGLYFAWDFNDNFWIAASYVGGEVDTEIVRPSGFNVPAAIEEVDSDIIFGWRFRKQGIDVGVGYRFAEFTTKQDQGSGSADSNGPMIFLGGGDRFKNRSAWGYHLGIAWMFEDMEDDDGAQDHFNVEAGFSWNSEKDYSILFGYRHKEYSGDGAGGLSFTGPVLNFSYTWGRE